MTSSSAGAVSTAAVAQRRELARAQAATMVAIFMLALLLASWAPRIPQLKSDLGFSDGDLGLALLGGPVGGLALLPAAGVLVRRLGSRVLVQTSLAGYCCAGLGLTVVTGIPSLFAVLAAWCALAGVLDLACNAQAALVEARLGRRIMMTVHASWTAGALVGAGVGAVAAAVDLALGVQFLVLGAVAAAAALPVTGWMLTGDRPGAHLPARDPASQPRSASRRRAVRWTSVRWSPRRRAAPLAPLCAIAFASFLGEGIAADWSAVYLTDVTGASPGAAGVGLVAFMTCMLVVRLAGDRVVEAHGAPRTIRPLALGAAAAFTLALTFGETPAGAALGIAGFAVLGAGLGCVVPAVFSAAAQRAARDGAPAGPALAVVSALGYVGWLAGPPLIGGLAEGLGLHTTMWVVVALTLVIAALSGILTGFAPPSSPSPGTPPETAAAAGHLASPGVSSAGASSPGVAGGST